MANRKGNIEPIRSTEEARKRGRNGGVKSGESRRRKKTMREIAQAIGSAKVANVQILEKMQELFGADKRDVTHDFLIVAKQFAKAEGGDTQSARFIADLKGEIKQGVEVTGAEGKPLIPENTMTLEELNKEIERLEKANAD